MTEATDYRPMWAELGLDLEKHDALLGVLGQVYGDGLLARRLAARIAAEGKPQTKGGPR